MPLDRAAVDAMIAIERRHFDRSARELMRLYQLRDDLLSEPADHQPPAAHAVVEGEASEYVAADNRLISINALARRYPNIF